jgi:hypothetical protein
MEITELLAVTELAAAAVAAAEHNFVQLVLMVQVMAAVAAEQAAAVL